MPASGTQVWQPLSAVSASPRPAAFRHSHRRRLLIPLPLSTTLERLPPGESPCPCLIGPSAARSLTNLRGAVACPARPRLGNSQESSLTPRRADPIIGDTPKRRKTVGRGERKREEGEKGRRGEGIVLFLPL